MSLLLLKKFKIQNWNADCVIIENSFRLRSIYTPLVPKIHIFLLNLSFLMISLSIFKSRDILAFRVFFQFSKYFQLNHCFQGGTDWLLALRLCVDFVDRFHSEMLLLHYGLSEQHSVWLVSYCSLVIGTVCI